MSRRALTLLELIVVIAIIAVLLGLLIPAIQKVRMAALTAAGSNQLRQISLATHNFASAHNGRMPSIDGSPQSANPGQSSFMALLPYLEQEDLWRGYLARNVPGGLAAFNVKVFVSPLDPTVPQPGNPYTNQYYGNTSYGANAYVFDGMPNIFRTYRDGTSTTIAYAEHYTWCITANKLTGRFLWPISDGSISEAGVHRPTFADGGPEIGKGINSKDFFPMAMGNPPMTLAADGASMQPALGVTFQVTPRLDDCNWRMANGLQPSGLNVAMGDGSVRILAPSIAAHIYWAMVTPEGGETILESY